MITLETQEKPFVICIFKNLIATHRCVAPLYGMKYCHWGGRPKSTRVYNRPIIFGSNNCIWNKNYL